MRDSRASAGHGEEILLPDKMIVLACGRPREIEEDMKKLNLGKVELRARTGGRH